MTVVLANNVTSTLALDLTSSAGSLKVASGTGIRFPAVTPGQYYYATLAAPDGRIEIVKVIARVGDTLSIVRGAENTLPTAFPAKSKVELRVTAQSVFDAIQDKIYQVQIHVGPTPPPNPTINMLWVDTN